MPASLSSIHSSTCLPLASPYSGSVQRASVLPRVRFHLNIQTVARKPQTYSDQSGRLRPRRSFNGTSQKDASKCPCCAHWRSHLKYPPTFSPENAVQRWRNTEGRQHEWSEAAGGAQALPPDCDAVWQPKSNTIKTRHTETLWWSLQHLQSLCCPRRLHSKSARSRWRLLFSPAERFHLRRLCFLKPVKPSVGGSPRGTEGQTPPLNVNSNKLTALHSPLGGEHLTWNQTSHNATVFPLAINNTLVI